MAKITLNSSAPKGKSEFVFAEVVFELDRSGSFESDDPRVISDAALHPFLDVDLDVGEHEATRVDYDENDPHDNPAADHLSIYATDEVKKAAEDNMEKIHEVTAPEYTPEDTAHADVAPDPALALATVEQPAPKTGTDKENKN